MAVDNWLAADGQTVTGADLRAINTALLDERPGLFASGSLLVSERGAGANMSVDVAAGVVAIPGTSPATFDVTVAEFLSVTNLTISAADPTNARDDFIAVKAHTDGTDPELVVIAGTPAAGDPTLPDNHFILARVNVAALASSIVDANIDDLRTVTSSPDLAVNQGQRATAKGGVVVCTSTTRPTANLYEGLHIYQTDDDLRYVYSGSTWILIGSSNAPTAFTPTLLGSTTDPTLGSGPTEDGFYQESNGFLQMWWNIVFGTGSTFGSGNYQIAVPGGVTIRTGANSMCAGSIHLVGTSQEIGTVLLSESVDRIFFKAPNSVGPTIPFTWADGDELRGYACIPID